MSDRTDEDNAVIDHNNLEEFDDADTYDIVDPSDTGVAFYTALARETGSPVLEIACGTGRVSIPIAQQGFAVTGVDIVPGMVERARHKSSGLPTRWVVDDARTFDLGEQFRLVFITGNAFQAFLTRAEHEALLDRVRAHLHDEGLFAFETRNPHWAALATRVERYDSRLFFDLETSTEEKLRQTYTDSSGRDVRTSMTQVYDPITQILHVTSYRRWHEGEQEHTKLARTALRYTFPQELAALLHYNGFTVLRQYGDWNLEPLTAASPSIISVCRKRS